MKNLIARALGTCIAASLALASACEKVGKSPTPSKKPLEKVRRACAGLSSGSGKSC